MRLTFRTKLVAIVGATAFALILFVVIGAVTAARVSGHLVCDPGTIHPKVELAPQLEGQFDLLRRALQDAVALATATPWTARATSRRGSSIASSPRAS